MEYFIHQSLWPNVIHVHLEGRFVKHGNGHDSSRLVELILDAIVHKSDETRSHDDTNDSIISMERAITFGEN